MERLRIDFRRADGDGDGGDEGGVADDGADGVAVGDFSVAGEGVMYSVDDTSEKRRVLLAMANAFTTEPFDYLPDAVVEMTAVWRLELSTLTGKSNPPPSA